MAASTGLRELGTSIPGGSPADLGYIYVTSADGSRVMWGDADVIWGLASELEPGPAQDLRPYSEAEYFNALASLLPVGAAWPRDPDSPLMRLVAAWAAELARLDARAYALLAEIDPAQTTELLPDWERVVGLPDPCVTQAQTVAARRLALQGRLFILGGQSRAFFIALAARLGYSVTIEEFPSEADAIAAGITYTGDEWAHIWRVNVPDAVGITPFRVGSGTAGEPLRTWGNQVLECQFNRFKPAHTRVLFAYEGA